MWTARFIVLGALVVFLGIYLQMLRHRETHRRLAENRALNAILVVTYNACCYLMVAALPPAGGWDHRPAWLMHPTVRIGFAVVGSILLCLGSVLAFTAVGQRRGLGMQEGRPGLLTTGVYRHFRHPIYAGILWVSLGLALVARNPDGLLMLPALAGVLTLQALIEEKYDMAVRFPEQYHDYRHAARMFGPAWLWGAIVVAILLVVGSGWW